MLLPRDRLNIALSANVMLKMNICRHVADLGLIIVSSHDAQGNGNRQKLGETVASGELFGCEENQWKNKYIHYTLLCHNIQFTFKDNCTPPERRITLLCYRL